MVLCEEAVFVYVRFFVVDAAEADGAKAYVDDAASAAAVGSYGIYVVHLARLSAHGAFAVLDAVVHIPSDIVRALQERFLHGDIPAEDEVDEVVEEVVCVSDGAVGQAEGICTGFCQIVPRQMIS